MLIQNYWARGDDKLRGLFWQSSVIISMDTSM